MTFITDENQQLAVVLVEPRIPQNAGNIGRLCSCTGVQLILVGDCGFNFDDKFVKRAGMDYLEHLTPRWFPDFPDVVEAYPDWAISFLSSKASQTHTSIPYQRNHLLVFGSETHGLPETVLKKYESQCFRIPMLQGRRSLNLSTSVGVVVYEALRQLNQW